MSQAAAPPQNFPDSLIDEIAETIGGTTEGERRQLAHFLRQMPANLALYRTRDAVPRPSRVRDRLERIEAACAKVNGEDSGRARSRVESLIERAEPETLDLLLWQYALIANPTHPEAAIADGSAQQGWGNALSNLSILRDVARAATICVSMAVRDGQGGDRYGEDWPLDQAILLLGTLYFEVTGDRPGISSDPKTRVPTGQFLAYLTLCLGELGYTFKPNALRSLYRRVRKRYPKDKILNPAD